MPNPDFLNKVGIQYPIIQGPLGGGPSTPELVAAVSNAGGMGSLGAAYMTPQQIREAIAKTKSLTDKPFNVNLFSGVKSGVPHPNPKPMLDVMADIHRQLEIEPPALPAPEPDPFPAQLEAILENPPRVFSFTFGVPGADIFGRLKANNLYVIGTATTLEEAIGLQKAGVDAVVVQGEEAGAHRGTFADAFEESMVPLTELLKAAVKALSLPVIAAGGLMDGRDVARVLALGAAAAMLGTAFLPCPECGASDTYKQAVLAAKQDTTVVTRAFSGRPARGLRNAFIGMLEGCEDIILPYPIQNALTRAMRAAAAKQGNSDYLSLWAGRGVTRARQMPAGQLVATLVDEMKATRS